MEPQPAKATSAARLSSLLARSRRHPSTLHMVIEALRAQGGTKGASVIAIKRFILAKYPAVDPVRLKYLLKRALAVGLSRGYLVRPRNSSALGATGRFKLAPERLQQKQAPGQEDPTGGPAVKPGRRGAAQALVAAGGEGGQGTAKEKPKAVKKQPRAKPMDAQPAAAAKPKSDGAKVPRAPGKGQSGPPAASDAKDMGGDSSDRPMGARAKGHQKAPAGNNKGKVPGVAPVEAEEAAPKKKGGKGKPMKPRPASGAGQGEAGAQQPAPSGAGKKVP